MAIVIWILSIILCAIGTYRRGKGWILGALLGLFFSVFGMIIVAMMPIPKKEDPEKQANEGGK